MFEGVWLESIDFSTNDFTGSITTSMTSYALKVSLNTHTCNNIDECTGQCTHTSQENCNLQKTGLLEAVCVSYAQPMSHVAGY